MKFLCIILTITACAFGQKPNYLSGNVGQPELAYRFRDNSSTSTTNSPLGNRLGEDGTTPKIPIDARGDYDLVNRLNEYPEGNRPYWLINYEAIERFRNQQAQLTNAQTSSTSRPVNLQGRFSGGGSGRPNNRVRDQRGFNPNVDYDDFGNPMN